MVAASHGQNFTLAELRRRFAVSLSGSSLKNLVSIADALGFSSRAVRCELDELGQLELPAILHWSLDHYVVLRRVDRRWAWISDPARGDRKVPLGEVSKHFTGVALELTPAPNFQKRVVAEKVRLQDLWSRLAGFRPYLGQVLLLTFLLQCTALIAPLASQLVIDDVIGRADRDLLVAIVVGFGLLALVQTAISTLRGFVQLHVGQRLSIQLSGNLLRHLLRLPAEFFERRHVGDVLSRFGSLMPVQTFLTSGLVGIILDAAMVLPIAIVMLIYSPALSAIAALNLLAIFAVRWFAFPVIRSRTDESLSLMARTETLFLETVRGARAIKLSGKEAERHGVWQNAFAEQQNLTYKIGVLQLWGTASLGGWQTICALAMLSVGALQVLGGSLTLGMFFAFQAYALQFGTRVSALVEALFQFRMLGLHLERLADIVHTDAEHGLDVGPASTPLSGAIELRNVDFRYAVHEPSILEGVTFRIEPGQSIAITGPSGGGKSTLLKMLTGLYAPSSGDVLIDGIPLRTMGVRAYRDRIGVVMQDDQLLSGSIADNVSFFDPSTDMAQVEKACRAAHVHDEIVRTPMGYHSLIGDMGSILSGGQKQRILLARALYRNPGILFMDEGTANLDPDLERLVMDSLAAMNITRVMVAHREAAMRDADRTFVVAERQVAEVTGPAHSGNDVREIAT